MNDDIGDASVEFYSIFETTFKKAFKESTSNKSFIASGGRSSLEGRLLAFSSGFGFSQRKNDSFPAFDFTTLASTDLSSMLLTERIPTPAFLEKFKAWLLTLNAHVDNLPEGQKSERYPIFDRDSFGSLDKAYERLARLWDMSVVNPDQGRKRMEKADRSRFERGLEGCLYKNEPLAHRIEPEEIVHLIKGEAGRLRALGKFMDALHLLEGIRAVAFAASNPFGLSDAAKIQVAAALVGVGHWTAHFAKHKAYRRRYLDFARRFDDPFFARYPLISAGYDDPNSDAFVKRYWMLKSGIKTQVTTYEFSGPTELYEISRYYVRLGVHPDTSLPELDGMTPDQVMRRGTDINLEDNNYEDALTEFDEAMNSYMRFDDLDKAMERLQQSEELIPNRDLFPYRNAYALRLKGDLLWRVGLKTGQQNDFRAGNSAWKESLGLFKEMNLTDLAKSVEDRIV